MYRFRAKLENEFYNFILYFISNYIKISMKFDSGEILVSHSKLNSLNKPKHFLNYILEQSAIYSIVLLHNG